MATEITLRINNKTHTVNVEADTPLLYVLSDDLKLQGPRYGCGLAQCGSCSVLVDDVEVRSCVTPVSSVANKTITTLEGLPEWYAEKENLSRKPVLHPVQQALIDEQAIQCGYCYNGMIIKASELLSNNPNPGESEIKQAMNGHLCRCGTYPGIVRAIRKAAQIMEENA